MFVLIIKLVAGRVTRRFYVKLIAVPCKRKTERWRWYNR